MSFHGYGSGYDIIFQIGDSNSYAGLNIDGTASYDPAVDTANSNCSEWRSAGHSAATSQGKPFFYPIVANSYHPFDYPPPGLSPVASAVNGVGPGENFVKAWQTNIAGPAGRKTMIVVMGVGGTALCGNAYWAATPSVGDGLTISVPRVNLILAQSSLNRLVAILWTQGANDGILEKTSGLTQAAYQDAFIATASYLRSTIVGTGASTAPILVQPLVPAFVTNPSTACPNVNAALANTPNIVSQCGYADPTGYTVLGQTAIPYHLCSTAQRLIGSTLFVNAYNSRSA